MILITFCCILINLKTELLCVKVGLWRISILENNYCARKIKFILKFCIDLMLGKRILNWVLAFWGPDFPLRLWAKLPFSITLKVKAGFELNDFLDDFTIPFSWCPVRECGVMEKSVFFRQWDTDMNHSSTTHCCVRLVTLTLWTSLSFKDYPQHEDAYKVCGGLYVTEI